MAVIRNALPEGSKRLYYKTYDHRDVVDAFLAADLIRLDYQIIHAIPPGRVRLEKVRPDDVVRNPDGSFNVTWRFTILPDPAAADEPIILSIEKPRPPV